MREIKNQIWITMTIVSLILFACSNQSPPGEKLKLGVQASKATVTIQIEDAMHPVVDINSRTGIGNAILIKENGQWPDKLKIRLHTSGLEHLSLANSHLEMVFSIISTGSHNINRSIKHYDKSLSADQSENLLQQVRIAATNSDGNQTLNIPLTSGWFQISVPGELLVAGTDTLRISWIDFYR